MRLPSAVACLSAAFVALGQAETTQSQSQRLTVIASDLHLNEDQPNEAVSSFLDDLDRRGEGRTDLVLAGDTLELAACERGCTELEAVDRLDRVLDAQPTLVAGLAAFATRGSNRVVFVPGDQDAALLFPRVAARLLERAQGVEVTSTGFWISDDGRVLVEHGHQLRGDPYRFDGWPRPFESDRLETSWGQRNVDTFYLEHATKFPALDGFAERFAGFKYGLSVEPGERVTPDVLREFLLNVAWQQFRRDLELQGEAPQWDVAAIRAGGDAFVLASVLEDDPSYDLWRRGGLSTNDLDDDELRLVCDYRAAVRRARRRMERGLTQLARVGPVVAECRRSESSRDPSFSYFWRSRDARYRERLRSLAVGLDTMPEVYVHGHTHLPDSGFAPGADIDTPRILNTGAFRRTITPVNFETMKEEKGATTGELLESLRPAGLPTCYSYAVLEPYERAPTPSLWYWRRSESGDWEAAARCE